VTVSVGVGTGGPVPVTVITLVAVRAPSTVLTVIVAVPALTAVTSPVLLTVATAVLLELHVTLLSEAFAGTTVAVSCCAVPAVNAAVAGVKVTDVTGTAVTITSLAAVRAPSTVLTVIVAVPAPIPKTLPVSLTMATELLLELHIRFLLEAFAGAIEAFSWSMLPAVIAALAGANVTPVTGTKVTVMTLVAIRPPSAVLTVMVAVPDLTPVIRPVSLTVATEESLELQVTFLLEAVAGATVAVNCCVRPIFTFAVAGAKVTPVTGITFTVTLAVAVSPPSFVAADMTALPPAIPLTNPVTLTVATEVLLEIHTTLLSVAFAGTTVALSCWVAPTFIGGTVAGVKVIPVTGTAIIKTFAVAVKPPSTVLAVITAVPNVPVRSTSPV